MSLRMMAPEEARQHVASGAAHLDTLRPGWAKEIDINTLNIGSGAHCIIGQLYGGFENHQQAGVSSIDLFRMGFYSPRIFESQTNAMLYQALNDAWVEAIADRVISATIQQSEINSLRKLLRDSGVPTT